MSDKKKLICGACNGTGYYDNTDSPKCSSCEGLGVERTKMPYRLWKHIVIKYYDVSIGDVEAVYEKFKFLW